MNNFFQDYIYNGLKNISEKNINILNQQKDNFINNKNKIISNKNFKINARIFLIITVIIASFTLNYTVNSFENIKIRNSYLFFKNKNINNRKKNNKRKTKFDNYINLNKNVNNTSNFKNIPYIENINNIEDTRNINFKDSFKSIINHTNLPDNSYLLRNKNLDNNFIKWDKNINYKSNLNDNEFYI